MKTFFVSKLNQLETMIVYQIDEMIYLNGVKSDFSSDKVLKVKHESYQFSIGSNGSYITEVGDGILIDQRGHRYYLDAIDILELCELMDYLLTEYNHEPKNKLETK